MEMERAKKQQVVRQALAAGWLFWSAVGGMGFARAAVPADLRLARKQDTFFIENDFVYRRFLQLSRDGSYVQINREHAVATEVDRGTWTQEADGTVLLRFTRGGLRWHALVAGPLSISLVDPQTFGALSTAAGTMRRWLAQSSDDVFAAEHLGELAQPPVMLTLDPKAESFRRAEVEALVRQIDDFVWSEQNRAFRMTLLKPPGSPKLLIQRGAVFEAGDLARVQQEYRVPRGQAPPFYFAQVDAKTFAREAGPWQKLP